VFDSAKAAAKGKALSTNHIVHHSKSRECVSMKIARLGLEVVTSANSSVTTTTLLDLPLPVELPSVEDQLKGTAASLKLMQTPCLSKDEVIRLRNVG